VGFIGTCGHQLFQPVRMRTKRSVLPRVANVGWLLLVAACTNPGASVDDAGGPPADSGATPDAGMSDAGGAPDAGEQPIGDDGAPDAGNPFGISSSASSSRSPQDWLPEIAAIGIGWLRGFEQGSGDAGLALAAANGVQVSGILISGNTFPTDLTAWGAYVTQTVTRYPTVRRWEVWNEPPNFSTDNSPADYAAIVAKAYDAAKAADPGVQIGLAAQSVNVTFLDQALDAGAADHFDYVTVHPYEMLGAVRYGYEAEFLSIVPTLRKMLLNRDPSRSAVPILFTEIGEPVGGTVDAGGQADTAIKAYTLSLAQGIARIHWFEGRDGDSGPFGFIDASGVKRPSYTAMQSLIAALTTAPRYVGWLQLGNGSPVFVFNTDGGSALVAWAQPGETPTLDFGQSVSVVDPRTGTSTQKTSVQLSPSPIIASPVPHALAAQARANRFKPYLWGGDFTQAQSVSFTAPSAEQGLHVSGATQVILIDGQPARDCSAQASQAFTVDPNFLSYTTVPIKVTAVVRGNGTGSPGFNLKYESTSGTKGTGGWFTVPGSDQWYTQTWTITDAQLVGKWAYNFTFDSDSTTYSGYSIQSVTVTKL
jgi:hypothetical protein